MSDEITIGYFSGSTVYAVIRSLAGLVWYVAGQVFEAWGTSGRTAADYAISLTDKSGALFLGDFDTNVPDDTRCLIQIYRQAGANPLDTDTPIGGPARRRWLDSQLWEDDTTKLNSAVNLTTATHTYTVTDSDGNGISDALVEAKLAGKTNVVQSARTNSSGQAVFYLPAGTYDFYVTKSGYSFTNPDQEVVS